MYSPGPKPAGGLLGGLSTKQSVSAFGKGRSMAAKAELGMEAAKGSQELAMNQKQQESQQRMQLAGNQAQRAGNETQGRIQAGNLANRKSMIDMDLAVQGLGQQKQRQLNFRQALFNSLTSDF